MVEMGAPSSLALATPQGGRPPTARQSRFRGGKLDLVGVHRVSRKARSAVEQLT
jgi:hypothetical protein